MLIKKLAIFTEGQTEQSFVCRLLREMATAKLIRIENIKLTGGGKSGPRVSRRLSIDAATDRQKFYVLIVDCTGDSRVADDVKNQYDTLVSEGYSEIIGIRDVRPATVADIPKIKRFLYYGIPTKPIRPLMVLTLMEIEAWFIAEYTHCHKIDSSLTLDVIKQTISFDPSTGDVETLETPSNDLDSIYRTAGQRYVKEKWCLDRTIIALDYARVYYELGSQVRNLGLLVGNLNAFLT